MSIFKISKISIKSYNIWYLVFISLIIRLIVIYLTVHLENYTSYGNLKYTDIDYRVYTAAAALIIQNKSPYELKTYRYPPLLAIIMTPNVLLFHSFGKIFFSFFDAMITYATWKNVELLTFDSNNNFENNRNYIWYWICVMNPISINICTRGSSDSIINYLLLMLIYRFQRKQYFIGGLLFGFAIYWRLYPIIYTLTLISYIYITEIRNKRFKSLFQMFLGIFISMLLLIIISFYFYGWNYINNSILYHFTRQDHRHNMSVYFYSTYLNLSFNSLNSMNFNEYFSHYFIKYPFIYQFLLIILCNYLLLSKKILLSQTILLQTIIFITYNKVITAQYFTWYVTLLPISLSTVIIPTKQYKKMSYISMIWLISLSFWLFNAYLLEFKGFNTFLMIWFAGLLFHIINVIFIIYLIQLFTSQDNILKNKEL